MSNLCRMAFFLLVGMLCIPSTANAAESYDSCTGFIDSVPTVITTQGVWCLRSNLATSMTNGNAITIATNNVTIDCNEFKLGGLGAGDASNAMGIRAKDRLNISIRRCSIRGFKYGIYLEGYTGGGHLVEDNRLDNNLTFGMYVDGLDNRVQRNVVHATGGADWPYTWGIWAVGDVVDNTISGVYAIGANTYPKGILAYGDGTEVRNNRVRGLSVSGGGSAQGVTADGSRQRVEGNHVSATVPTTGYGIFTSGTSFCSKNTQVNFSFSTSCTAF